MADTLKSLRDEVLSWIDEAGNTSTTATNVDAALNQAHLTRCTQARWPFMKWPRWESFSTVSGQRVYTLHGACFDLELIKRQDTGAPLTEITARDAEDFTVSETNTATPEAYRFLGESAMMNQPTAAGTLSIVSSNNGDTGTTYGVVVRGWDASGIALSETIVPTGTTPSVSTNSFYTVESVTPQGTWAGTLTVSCGAVTVTQVRAGTGATFYPRIELTAPADSVITFDYSFYRAPSLLTLDNDVVAIPHPFSKILVWDALISFGGYNTDIANQALSLWSSRAKALETQMQQHYLAGQTVGAKARYVATGDTVQSGVRIQRS